MREVSRHLGEKVSGRVFPGVPGPLEVMAWASLASHPVHPSFCPQRAQSRTCSTALRKSLVETLVSALDAAYWYISLDLPCLISEVTRLSPPSESEVETDGGEGVPGSL